MHIQQNIIQPQKEGNHDIYNNMVKSWGLYAKWNKSDRRTNTVIYSIYVSTKTEFLEAMNRLLVVQDRVRWNGRNGFRWLKCTHFQL